MKGKIILAYALFRCTTQGCMGEKENSFHPLYMGLVKKKKSQSIPSEKKAIDYNKPLGGTVCWWSQLLSDTVRYLEPGFHSYTEEDSANRFYPDAREIQNNLSSTGHFSRDTSSVSLFVCFLSKEGNSHGEDKLKDYKIAFLKHLI